MMQFQGGVEWVGGVRGWRVGGVREWVVSIPDPALSRGKGSGTLSGLTDLANRLFVVSKLESVLYHCRSSLPQVLCSEKFN